MSDRVGGDGRRERLDPGPAGGGAAWPGPSRSGRRFVLGAALALAAVVAGLALAFAAWRAENRALADFGAREVAPILDPLADRVPSGVPAEEWPRNVAEARRLVETLAGSGALDRPALEALAAELRGRVAGAIGRADADPAVALNDLWTDLEARAGPVLTRAPRFQLAGSLAPLARLDPPEIAPADWSRAVLRSRAAFAAAADPARIAPADRRALRDALARRLAAPTPETAAADLADAWRIVGDRVPAPFAPPLAPGPGPRAPRKLGRAVGARRPARPRGPTVRARRR